MTLTLIIVYSRWYNHSGWHYTYTLKSTNVRKMETNTFRHSSVQNIQVYKLKKTKTKHFYIVNIKYCLIIWNLSCTIYLITYVSISLVWRPKRNGNNKFRFFHCIKKKKKRKINQMKDKRGRFRYKMITYSSQFNEYTNSKSNSSIEKISGNIIYMLCIFFETRYHSIDWKSSIIICIYSQRDWFPCLLNMN